MEHGSLAYGADWCRSSVEDLPELPAEYDSANNSSNRAAAESDGLISTKSVEKNVSTCGQKIQSRSSLTVLKDDQLIASCSFYDHQMRIWALSSAA